jgi:hypothetical protein
MYEQQQQQQQQQPGLCQKLAAEELIGMVEDMLTS